MGLKQKLKNIPVLYNAMLSVLNSVDYFNIRFRSQFPRYKITPTWKKRLDLVKLSSDNSKIDKVKDAGVINHDHQVMHNGLKIALASYYDYGNTILIRDNEGVHEPQEEYVFQEVLKFIPEGGTMLELGSFWAFYSMWFANNVKDSRCVMIEPDPHKMNFGKLNFRMNKLKGTFDLGFIGKDDDLSQSIPFYSVDYLMKKHSINFLNILHSDIQGYEFDMLTGSKASMEQKKIGYFFISTHSNLLHEQCENTLKSYGYEIMFSANLDESYSWDGLLVAKQPGIPGPTGITIAKRNNG